MCAVLWQWRSTLPTQKSMFFPLSRSRSRTALCSYPIGSEICVIWGGIKYFSRHNVHSEDEAGFRSKLGELITTDMTENLEARPAQLKKLCHVSVRGRKSGLSFQRAVSCASWEKECSCFGGRWVGVGRGGGKPGGNEVSIPSKVEKLFFFFCVFAYRHLLFPDTSPPD